MIVYLLISLLAVVARLCLWGGYHSTDFEVHRNWMAITYHFPFREWYFEETSIWTLDYPPFFAYFEWILANFAAAIFGSDDPAILRISENAVVSKNIIMFQRTTVVICDFVLFVAAAKYISNAANGDGDRAGAKMTTKDGYITFALIAFNSGLLLVDHIHFQYNGLLLGILILCLNFAQSQKYVASAITFSILVLMKHLFVTLVPLFMVYFWSAYCAPHNIYTSFREKFWKLGRLILIALLMLTTAIGPLLWSEISNIKSFAYTRDEFKDVALKQLQQLLTRLLPFGRGLVHTYWAPNVWAFYYASDRATIYLLTLIGVKSHAGVVSSVSGVLGDVHPVVLPTISAKVCLMLTFLSMAPALVQIYKKPTSDKLVQSVVYCSMCAFMLGYHVHEKAILVPLVIQTLLMFSSPKSYIKEVKGDIPSTVYLFIVLAVAGIFGLFPLFIDSRELVIKTLLHMAFVAAIFFIPDLSSCRDETGNEKEKKMVATYVTEKNMSQFPLRYLLTIFIVLHGYNNFGHTYFEAFIGRKLEFLPLMLTSVIAAIFLVYAWALSLQQLF